MGNRKYPVESWSIASRKNRPGITNCARCKYLFDQNEQFIVVDRQVSWFRGDDEVEGFHKKCTPAKAWKQIRKDREI